MIRLTLRQFRGQAAAAAAALVAVAVVAMVTGAQDSGLRMWLGVAVVVSPGVVGAFWGAPLVAGEIEDGTLPLVWTQSVTRTRWLAVKLAVVGLASVATAGLLSLAITWWAGSVDRAGANAFGTYDQRDLVPVGYAAFAFALGVAAGVLIRRTLPAMAATLALFITVRLSFNHWLRPGLMTPASFTTALDPSTTGYGSSGFLPFALGPGSLQPQPPSLPNAWITALRIVDGTGRGLTNQVLQSTCPGIGSGRPDAGGAAHVPAPPAARQGMEDCVSRIAATYHELISYQPANHYWPLQWSETALYLAASLLLAALTVWRVRRGLSPT